MKTVLSEVFGDLDPDFLPQRSSADVGRMSKITADRRSLPRLETSTLARLVAVQQPEPQMVYALLRVGV